MKTRRIDRMAVFHDRESMEKAVRGLVANGMPPTRIRVSRGTFGDRAGRAARPDRGGMVAFGVAIGAVTGAALTLVWMSWLSDLVAIPLPLIVHQTADGAASGGIVGALLALIVLAAHHKDRYELDTKADDFLVVVRSPNAMVANDVDVFLAFCGGDLVATRWENAEAPPIGHAYRHAARSGMTPAFA